MRWEIVVVIVDMCARRLGRSFSLRLIQRDLHNLRGGINRALLGWFLLVFAFRAFGFCCASLLFFFFLWGSVEKELWLFNKCKDVVWGEGFFGI